MSSVSIILNLSEELQREGSTKANNVVQLLAAVTPGDDVCTKAAVSALKLFFVDASQDGDLGAKKQDEVGDADAAEDVYRQWLRRQYSSYKTALLKLLSSPDSSSGVQIVATSALMEAVRCEMGVGVFASGTFCQLLTYLVSSAAVKPEAFTYLFNRYFQYADVRFFSLWAIREIALQRTSKVTQKDKTSSSVPSMVHASMQQGGEELSAEDVARCIFDILTNLPDDGLLDPQDSSFTSWCGLEEVGEMKGATDKSESAKARRKRKLQELQKGREAVSTEQKASWANPKTVRRMFSDAWGSFLQMPIPDDIYRKVLLRLHGSVIPNMTNPVVLADFLTHALNQGGIIGMLSLHGIFVLVTQHGLEYPAFYTRLYSLITAEAFAAKHRAQFFKLADLFLSSGLVPAYTAAAFAKKMARFAVSAPPAGALLSIAFIHNLIRRHPACMVLLDNPSVGAGAGKDVFDETQSDPAKSRAVESSLWELTCLRNHYCPQVAALCAILDKDLSDRRTTTEVDVDPLVSASYTSLFSQEVERRLKQVPLAFYKQVPTKLFDAENQVDFEGWTV